MTTHLAERRLIALERERGEYLTENEMHRLGPSIKNFKKSGPELTTFRDDDSKEYNELSIRRDILKTKEYQKEHSHKETQEEKELKFYATVLEIVIEEFANSWLPGSVSKASEFDDVMHRTDLFWEAEDEKGKILRAAIDVTSSPINASEKLKKTVRKLMEGKFQRVKYFESDLDDTKGGLELPRIIIGADRREITELARLYLSYDNAPDNEARKRFIERVKQHRVGEELVDEMLEQINKALLILNRTSLESAKSDINEKITYLKNIETILFTQKIKMEQEKIENKKAPKPTQTGERSSKNKVYAAIHETLNSAY